MQKRATVIDDSYIDLADYDLVEADQPPQSSFMRDYSGNGNAISKPTLVKSSFPATNSNSSSNISSIMSPQLQQCDATSVKSVTNTRAHTEAILNAPTKRVLTKEDAALANRDGFAHSREMNQVFLKVSTEDCACDLG